MAKIISFTNQKGGVGKTTTTCAVAAGLKKRGYRVLAIDLDPQANLSFSVGAETVDCATIYDVLKGEIKTLYAIQKKDSFDIISSNIMLSAIELEFTQAGREFLLRDALLSIEDRYDYIIIDTPPALGILTVNAFSVSNSIIIPMHSDIFSLQGIAQLAETISRVKSYCNPNIKIGGILLTKYNSRTSLGKEVAGTAELIANDLDTILFKSTIRNSVAIMEAQTNQKNIYDYSPKNAAVIDYSKFVDELLSKEI